MSAPAMGRPPSSSIPNVFLAISKATPSAIAAAPPARARRTQIRVAAVGYGSRPGDHDDAGLPRRTGFERDERIVDDQRLRLLAEAGEHAANRVGLARLIDAGHAEADGRGSDRVARHRAADEFAEHGFDPRRPERRQMRTGAANVREHPALVIGQLADRLRAARIDAQNRHRGCTGYLIPAYNSGQCPADGRSCC